MTARAQGDGQSKYVALNTSRAGSSRLYLSVLITALLNSIGNDSRDPSMSRGLVVRSAMIPFAPQSQHAQLPSSNSVEAPDCALTHRTRSTKPSPRASGDRYHVPFREYAPIARTRLRGIPRNHLLSITMSNICNNIAHFNNESVGFVTYARNPTPFHYPDTAQCDVLAANASYGLACNDLRSDR